MKKILYLSILAVILLFSGAIFQKAEAQWFDAKLNILLYDSFPGYANTTQYYNSYAGRFRVNLPGNNRTLRVDLTLPTVLADGSNTIPISFASNNAAYKRGGNLSPFGSTLFNPNNQLIINMGNRNRVTFWLGATVTPPPGAAASDNYQGTIVITAEIL